MTMLIWSASSSIPYKLCLGIDHRLGRNSGVYFFSVKSTLKKSSFQFNNNYTTANIGEFRRTLASSERMYT